MQPLTFALIALFLLFTPATSLSFPRPTTASSSVPALTTPATFLSTSKPLIAQIPTHPASLASTQSSIFAKLAAPHLQMMGTLYGLIKALWKGDYVKFWNLWGCVCNRAQEARLVLYLIALRLANLQFRGVLQLIGKVFEILGTVDLC